MRKKSTVYSQEFHNQFQESEEQIKLARQKKGVGWKKDEKEGQSGYRIKEATKKQSV